MTLQTILLHLSLIEDVGPALINRILETVKHEQLADIYEYTAQDFVYTCGIPPASAHIIVQGLADRAMLERECSLLEKEKIHLLTIFDDGYPSLLKHIHLPPTVLYYKGQPLQDSVPAIAFVGARAATQYGKKAIDALIPPLIEHGWNIVSGGALGIDTFAHQAALKAQGKTTVVLGSGLLRLYPARNKDLFDAVIEQGGTIVSSFHLNMEPLQGNFPARNRIIAGLSKACVVVQAAQKSGSLITASLALEQGKEIFAVPGHFDDPMSAGCHALLKQGAHVATSAYDILQEFGYVAIQPEKDQKNVAEKNDTITIGAKQTSHVSQNPLVALCKQPISIDELEQKTGLSLLALQTALFDLQLEGHLSQNFMGLWQQR